MEFKISTSENEEYLIVEARKAVTAELGREMIEETLKEVDANNLNKIFIDVSRGPNTSTITEKYRFAFHETERLGHPKNVKIALFVRPEDHSRDFIKTLFQDAGYNCLIFPDKNSAIEWLTK